MVDARHCAPCQVSTIGTIPVASVTFPTATQAAGPEHETADNEPFAPRGGVGAVKAIQVLFVSISISGR